jgi:hypothetical protein
MAQVKIYGLKSSLDAHKAALSRAIHESVVAALAYPADKQFHRFIGLAHDDFVYPADRSANYTIIEITLFETPRENWGIRGLPGDELSLNYKVQV